MGVCYINKNPKQIVMNSKLSAVQTKSDNFPKSKLLLIKTNQLITCKHRIRQVYYSNSLRQISFSDYMKIVRESKSEKKYREKNRSFIKSFISENNRRRITSRYNNNFKYEIIFNFPESKKI